MKYSKYLSYPHNFYATQPFSPFEETYRQYGEILSKEIELQYNCNLNSVSHKNHIAFWVHQFHFRQLYPIRTEVKYILTQWGLKHFYIVLSNLNCDNRIYYVVLIGLFKVVLTKHLTPNLFSHISNFKQYNTWNLLYC